MTKQSFFNRNGVKSAVACLVGRKKTFFSSIIFIIAISSFSYAQDGDGDVDVDGFGVSVSFGYGPWQQLEYTSQSGEQVRTNDGNAIAFDVSSFGFFGDVVCLGFGGGAGIRSYNVSGYNILNTDDPYKTRLTRFYVHGGPALKISVVEDWISFCLSPQAGLWYAGMTNNGPKVNFNLDINADIIIGNWVSIGITYRALKTRLCSTNWNIYTPLNSYCLVKPSIELRIGLFLLG